MRKRRVQPNVRTVNTLLRGCLLHGDPARAVEVLRAMTTAADCCAAGPAAAGGGLGGPGGTAGSAKKGKKRPKLESSGASGSSALGGDPAGWSWAPVDPDGSSLEYSVALLAQALRPSEAAQLA